MGLYGDFSDRVIQDTKIKIEKTSKLLTSIPCFIHGTCSFHAILMNNGRTKTRQNRADWARNARNIPWIKQEGEVRNFDVFLFFILVP